MGVGRLPPVAAISPLLFGNKELDQLFEAPGLMNSGYEDNRDLVYKLGKAYVYDIEKDEEQYNIHIILIVPRIHDNVYPVFSVNQVGFYHNNSCWRNELPPYAFEKNEMCYSINHNTCVL